MNQFSGRQGGHIAVLTDGEFTVNGKACNGLQIDIEANTLTLTKNEAPIGPAIPLKPQANTVEYAILLRDDTDTEVARSGYTARF